MNIHWCPEGRVPKSAYLGGQEFYKFPRQKCGQPVTLSAAVRCTAFPWITHIICHLGNWSAGLCSLLHHSSLLVSPTTPFWRRERHIFKTSHT